MTNHDNVLTTRKPAKRPIESAMLIGHRKKGARRCKNGLISTTVVLKRSADKSLSPRWCMCCLSCISDDLTTTTHYATTNVRPTVHCTYHLYW